MQYYLKHHAVKVRLGDLVTKSYLICYMLEISISFPGVLRFILCHLVQIGFALSALP
jgi:hypothetical protein